MNRVARRTVRSPLGPDLREGGLGVPGHGDQIRVGTGPVERGDFFDQDVERQETSEWKAREPLNEQVIRA